MRRIVAALLVPLAGCAVLAGCSSSKPPAAVNANAAVKVTGKFGQNPTVAIPASKASTKLVISTPIKGTGAALTTGSAALANVAVYKWSGTTHSLHSAR